MGNEGTTQLAVSVKEAVKITGLGRTTLWKAINSGSLKSFRVGRRVLFSPDHLREFLAMHERKAEGFHYKAGMRGRR